MIGKEGDGQAASGAGTPASDWPLEERPGFLIRRAHQIHVSLFTQICAAFRVTPLQYSLLSALIERDGADQATLSDRVALDRTTTAGVLKRLEARGLVHRSTSSQDRRAYACRLTLEGHALHGAMEAAARRAHEVTIAMLSQEEGRLLVTLLKRVVSAHEERKDGADLV